MAALRCAVYAMPGKGREKCPYLSALLTGAALAVPCFMRVRVPFGVFSLHLYHEYSTALTFSLLWLSTEMSI